MITGTVTTVYGPDINTDDIIPALFLQQSTDRGYFKDYAFEKFDPDFRERCRQTTTNIVVAGANFGCGSSREQAVYAIKDNDVVCVIAQSYPDIFYRNSLSNGLVLITVPDVSSFSMGDSLKIDLAARTIENLTQETVIGFDMNPDDSSTFQQGGTIGRVRAHVEEILSQA
ncbi:3-isopropylmalate dehydratase small subunit [candidate division KSB3 bacterium]|uniref:3-isopropylmalate dehydratase small subunit n=1 Tax=candidate division KSB3 bacterium TaxID=2044937 RepID=A0A2G6E826_9BACT|nr:MAG: 3-isopropylmalate dehydratase small subunit [candidate division KSB3 bacterium]PIE30563.1 MAG: 3-isopropylmalate dehydratase small subunit [candidate division KSB3 bacterium]